MYAAVAENAEEGAGYHDRREHGEHHTDGEQYSKAAHRAAGEREQNKRRDKRGYVPVEDSPEALIIAGLDGAARRLTAPDLLLYSLEDHNVSVRRDPDGEHDARDPGQRHRDRDDHDESPQQECVDQQRKVRDDAERPIDDEQQQKHEHEADERCQQPAPEGAEAERRSYGGLGDHRHVYGQRAGVEHGLELFGLVFRETTGQTVVGDGDVLAEGLLDLGSALDILVERDPEKGGLPARGGVGEHALGELAHLAAALGGQLEAHDASARLLVDLHVGPGLLER